VPGGRRRRRPARARRTSGAARWLPIAAVAGLVVPAAGGVIPWQAIGRIVAAARPGGCHTGRGSGPSGTGALAGPAYPYGGQMRLVGEAVILSLAGQGRGGERSRRRSAASGVTAASGRRVVVARAVCWHARGDTRRAAVAVARAPMPQAAVNWSQARTPPHAFRHPAMGVKLE
jgi:hypothetical protein